MLFTDIDGTLLNSRSEITDANIQAAGKAIAAGKQIVLCSGRSWRSMAHFEEPLGINNTGQYGVSFNGGIVYGHISPDNESRNILSKTLLPNALGLQVTTRLKELGADIVIYAGEECYAENKGSAESNRQYAYRVSSKIPIRFVDDYSEIKDDYIKILALGELPELQTLHQVLAPEFGGRVYTIFSCPTLLEFGPPQAHKGKGVKFLAEHLHIPLSEVIAMGDEGNDLTMLKTAGLGIAVANAIPEAKAAAKIVSPYSNDEDAFARVIEEYLL
jgi:Cof subfamily protein (haloacid dehalogenase superfamily)